MRLGTRGSALAMTQAHGVAEALGGAEVVPIRTADGAPRPPGWSGPGGDKSRFVRGIEVALLDGEVDVGVHSAKDLPSELPGELMIAGVPRREDAADAYVGEAGALAEIRAGARVGTSSARRRAQLLAARPDLDVVALRGNVDTRLRRLADGDFDGIVVAAAGLRRLGREGEISFMFEPDAMTPAAGQGALALEARRDDEGARRAAAAVSDARALTEVVAERATVADLDASCATPVGVEATLEDGQLRMDAFVGMPDGSEWIRDSVDGDPDDPTATGRQLAARLLSAGAGDLLERLQRG